MPPETEGGLLPSPGPFLLITAKRNKCIEFLKEDPHGVLALNGFDVLEMWIGIRPVLEVLKRAHTQVDADENGKILSINTRIISEKSVLRAREIANIVVMTGQKLNNYRPRI
jgi:hypothetical protein